MNLGKNFRIFGFRSGQIGDSVMALSVLNWCEHRYPGSYKYWQLARRYAHSAPLYFNHPFIDKIVIADGDDWMGAADHAIASSCDIVFNVAPDHPFNDIWPNEHNIYEETFVMAGLPIDEYRTMSPEGRRPKLTKWFSIDRRPKTIAIWPCAGYGNERARHPTQEWYMALVESIKTLGFNVIQYGHPNDFSIGATEDLRALPFFDQIKLTCGADLVISTDSGSGIIFGAYSLNQITLLTNHFPGHVRNLEAFGPDNPHNVNLFAPNGADNINRSDVLSAIGDKV